MQRRLRTRLRAGPAANHCSSSTVKPRLCVKTVDVSRGHSTSTSRWQHVEDLAAGRRGFGVADATRASGAGAGGANGK